MATDGTTTNVVRTLSLEFLKKITNDFSHERKLGQGGFGTVYKGTLVDGTDIAVKKLNENSLVTRDQQFHNEVDSLMEIQHENIVKLVAFCYETRKEVVKQNNKLIIADSINSLLCYEFLSEGSLEKHIFGPTSIDWKTRFIIIKGICKGLHFLHKEMKRPIIHMDLKPENILLDEKMVPKIADFGLARLFGEGQTRTITGNIVGTIGYVAPEFVKGGEISTRSDIYSLGLLIIEITTREKNNSCYSRDASAVNFIDSIRQNWKDDPTSSKFSSFDEAFQDQVKACIKIGLRCVEHDRDQRPSIEEVVRELNEVSSVDGPSIEDIVN